MKSFTQLILLAASLAMVAARTLHSRSPQVYLDPCTPCTDADCDAYYGAPVTLEETSKASNGLVRTFQTETNPGDAAYLAVSFLDGTSLRKATPSGTLTSQYDETVVVTIDLLLKGARMNGKSVEMADTLKLKVAPGSMCSISLPGSYLAKDITKVDLFMHEE